jgi:hypothetical protein
LSHAEEVFSTSKADSASTGADEQEKEVVKSKIDWIQTKFNLKKQAK